MFYIYITFRELDAPSSSDWKPTRSVAASGKMGEKNAAKITTVVTRCRPTAKTWNCNIQDGDVSKVCPIYY